MTSNSWPLTYTIISPADMITLGTTLPSIGSKFLVYWELWAGKTHLCKWFAQVLSIDPNQVKSPTYVYYHEYNNQLFHGDFYRIDDPSTLVLRWISDIIENYDYCFIEWPNFPEYYVDSTWHTITIERDPKDQDHRLVTISPYNNK